MTWRDAAVLMTAVVLCFACSLVDQRRHMAIIVELDVFSGRPNPSWTLSAEESAALAAMLADFTPADSSTAAVEERLGYRGLLVLNQENAAGLPGRMRVYKGTVTLEKEGRLQVYRDTHGIESWLLQQAARHGYGAIVDSLLLLPL